MKSRKTYIPPFLSVASTENVVKLVALTTKRGAGRGRGQEESESLWRCKHCNCACIRVHWPQTTSPVHNATHKNTDDSLVLRRTHHTPQSWRVLEGRETINNDDSDDDEYLSLFAFLLILLVLVLLISFYCSFSAIQQHPCFVSLWRWLHCCTLME